MELESNYKIIQNLYLHFNEFICATFCVVGSL